MKFNTKKTNSLTKKRNYIENFKNLRNKIHNTEKTIHSISRELSSPNSEKSCYYQDLKDELYESKKYLEVLKTTYNKIVKKLSAIGLILGLVLTIASSSIATYISNENYDDTMIETSNALEETNLMDDSISPNSLKDYIQEYAELSEKDNLTENEKKHLKDIKTLINNDPEGITQLSLEFLKQKIAKSFGIEDFNRIKIIDNSTNIKADKFHPESGCLTDISISLDGNTILSKKEFSNVSSGSKVTYSDNIDKDILNAIDSIVVSQSDPKNNSKAIKALKSSLDVDSEKIKPDVNLNNER